MFPLKNLARKGLKMHPSKFLKLSIDGLAQDWVYQNLALNHWNDVKKMFSGDQMTWFQSGRT